MQFPDPLYRRLKRVARQLDWSLAEVVRRAAESFVERFPEDAASEREWQFPAFDDMEGFAADPATTRPEVEVVASRGQDR